MDGEIRVHTLIACRLSDGKEVKDDFGHSMARFGVSPAR